MFCEENKFYSGKLLTCAEPNKVINNFPPKFTEIKLLTIKSMTKRHLKSYQQLINNWGVHNFMGKSLCIPKNCCILVEESYI